MANIFWIDKERKKYYAKDVTNRHLLNIIKYIAKGGGYLSFLSYNVINDIYDEAIMRGLRPNCTRSELLKAYDIRISDYECAMEQDFTIQRWHGQD